MMQQTTLQSEQQESPWGSLYRIGGVAALLMVALTLGQFVVFFLAPLGFMVQSTSGGGESAVRMSSAS